MSGVLRQHDRRLLMGKAGAKRGRTFTHDALLCSRLCPRRRFAPAAVRQLHRLIDARGKARYSPLSALHRTHRVNWIAIVVGDAKSRQCPRRAAIVPAWRLHVKASAIGVGATLTDLREPIGCRRLLDAK